MGFHRLFFYGEGKLTLDFLKILPNEGRKAVKSP